MGEILLTFFSFLAGFKSLQMCSTTLAMLMRQLMTLFSRSLRKKMLHRVKDDRDAFVDVGSMILHMDTMPQVSGKIFSFRVPITMLSPKNLSISAIPLFSFPLVVTFGIYRRKCDSAEGGKQCWKTD